MRKLFLLISLIGVILLAACGPAANTNESVEPNTPSELPAQPANDDKPTLTPPPLPDSYPAPATSQSTSEQTDGYPGPPPAAPAADAYPGAYPAPGEFVWMIRPLGEQCAEPNPNNPTDLTEAVASLTAAGITTGKAEMIELMVCSACGCPTSAHFRIQIDAADVKAAESLDWIRE